MPTSPRFLRSLHSLFTIAAAVLCLTIWPFGKAHAQLVDSLTSPNLSITVTSEQAQPDSAVLEEVVLEQPGPDLFDVFGDANATTRQLLYDSQTNFFAIIGGFLLLLFGLLILFSPFILIAITIVWLTRQIRK